MIRSNAHKYPISAMCKILCIARSTYYYESNTKDESELETLVETIFNQNRKVYGCRKIKVILQKQGLTLSRRKIGCIMKKRNLVSAYSISKFKVHKSSVNEAEIQNVLNRQFNQSVEYAAVVSDLTYVRVNYKGIISALLWIFSTVKSSDTVQEHIKIQNLYLMLLQQFQRI